MIATKRSTSRLSKKVMAAPPPFQQKSESLCRMAVSSTPKSATLLRGVQGASRPRTGPSPPVVDKQNQGSHEPPFRPASGPWARILRRFVIPSRHFPVRPDLDQLKHQAKDLLRAFRRNEPEAINDFREFAVKAIDPQTAKLADAQFVLARSYGLPHWPRLVVACRMTDAIWRGDVEAVRALVTRNPKLLEEDARGVTGNWGPPLSYAANLGKDAIIEMLRSLGAKDFAFAFGR